MHMRRGLVLALAVPVAFAALSISVPMADASIGVGVQAAPVRLADAALTGQSYALPPVYVSDTGTQPETIAVQVDRLSTGRGRSVPQSWVRATGPAVHLSPHQGAQVPLQLTVPAGAKPGRYLSDIVVTAAPGASVGHVNLGVAAATPLEFTVRQGAPAVASWLRRGRAPAAVAILAAAGLAACSATPTSSAPGTPGGSSSISISLKTVPTLVSVTVSPSTARFGGCSGGNRSVNTASTSGALGFPNGQCWLGKAGSGGSYPITITNTGVAAKIFVNGGNAVPSDGGTQWGLCNLGSSPAVACANRSGKMPGNNQYLLQNFAAGSDNTAGLTNNSVCDPEFSAGSCQAVTGDAQQEGIEITGPELSSDVATSWTLAIKWTAVSLGD